ncbi:hypothetical protein SEA_NICHOLAS_32 [Mycobacterium phage Nicholas]|uniref:Uncharacterized protein n=1 Tax=Mycobacterium phage Lumos TaxID=1701852 RepID=A0A0K2CMC8_9CAUD|nr:hypothetical protein AVU96_gp032 [Mycobacterium phage Snenia]YP_010012490.1 hypothetical protein J4T93_gp032 [Mycobacterium phage Lumos]ASM62770.1 hypothetical protein SEA_CLAUTASTROPHE_32 [Mycobacterium phage Clautastrophe]ASR86962.1 hypothetical protein SEA_KINGSOLOMON_32 [Mycobacterium phage Kingsolomon]ASR87304.1 hypothetical protein SEA_NICHOLAS_32 [Mycobacterium phage Nicholas]QPL14916.1 hypothetical protein SEA_JUBIE_32 [Mycobacterium phage Jubie]ALA06548.1 hypothetical protein SEA_
MGELIVWLVVGAVLFAVVSAIWKWVLLGLALYLTFKLTKRSVAYVLRRMDAHRKRERDLVHRAYEQDSALLRGDELRGYYGEYPPVTWPDD